MTSQQRRRRILTAVGLLPLAAACNEKPASTSATVRLPTPACDYETGCLPAADDTPKRPAPEPHQACSVTLQAGANQATAKLVPVSSTSGSGDAPKSIMMPVGADFDARQTEEVRRSGQLKPMKNPCCYTRQLGCMGGRPLRPNGDPLLADLIARADWRRELGAIDLAAGTVSGRRQAAQRWRRAAQFEHASVASFACLSLQLLRLAAPPEFIRDAHRAAQDEVAHAEIGFALADLLDGQMLGPGALDAFCGDNNEGLVALAVESLRDGCVEETVAAAVADEAARAVKDDGLRVLLTRIARDERRHSELAFRILFWALTEGGEPVRRAVEDELLRLGHGDRALRCGHVVQGSADGEPAWGRLSSKQEEAIQRAVIADVVVPCVAQMLNHAASKRSPKSTVTTPDRSRAVVEPPAFFS